MISGNSNNTPLVAIAMCTYNGAAYLKKQLDTIITQTYRHLEIIIIDDHSADDTVAIIKEYAATDNRIIFYANETNLGFNKNFEKAILLCSAEFIAIADQDDVWEHNKIELMLQGWLKDALFVYSLSGNFSGNDFENRKYPSHIIYANIDDVHKLVFNSPVHGHACMFKKELLPLCTPFPDDIFYDWWISMHAAAIGTIGCIPQTLTWHRHHESNSSRKITSIQDKEQRNQQLRQQCVFFIETFCSRGLLKTAQQNSLLEYASLLKKMDGKKFSWAMFRYVYKNRKIVFHYKKTKPLIFISYLKNAIKMGYKGLL